MSWIDAIQNVLQKIPEIEARHMAETGYPPTRIKIPMPDMKTPSGGVVEFYWGSCIVSEDREGVVVHDKNK